MQQVLFRAMGSEIFCVVDSLDAHMQARLERMPVMFEAWEQILSRFRGDSELARLNARPGQDVRVSETLWSVLELAQSAEIYSGGLVNPTILTALERAGYDRSFETLAAQQESGKRTSQNHPVYNVNMKPAAWSLSHANRTVRLEPGTRLDLGGVAKGWAAERAAEYLGELGPALVDGGGDIVITAPRADGKPWTIGIEHPYDPREETLPLLYLLRGAVATSGRDYKKWTCASGTGHHLIDPRTGSPSQTDIMTATIIAPEMFRSEVAAKTAMLLGSKQGMAWIQAQHDLAALFFLEDETVLTSASMLRYIE